MRNISGRRASVVALYPNLPGGLERLQCSAESLHAGGECSQQTAGARRLSMARPEQRDCGGQRLVVARAEHARALDFGAFGGRRLFFRQRGIEMLRQIFLVQYQPRRIVASAVGRHDHVRCDPARLDFVAIGREVARHRELDGTVGGQRKDAPDRALAEGTRAGRRALFCGGIICRRMVSLRSADSDSLLVFAPPRMD